MICLEEEFEDTKGGNQNPYIEEELTAQWPKEKGQTTIMYYRYCKTKSYSQSSEAFTDFVHITMTQIFYISGTISADIVNTE
jgi:hypothetical protein